jgi:hypothetical protein
MYIQCTGVARGWENFPLFAIRVSLLVSALDTEFEIATLIPLLQFSKLMLACDDVCMLTCAEIFRLQSTTANNKS